MTLAPGTVFSPPLVAYVAAGRTWSFTFLDESGTAYAGLDGDTLALTVHDGGGNELVSVTVAASDNTAVFVVAAEDHAAAGVNHYSVRNNSNDDELLAANSYRILETAA